MILFLNFLKFLVVSVAQILVLVGLFFFFPETLNWFLGHRVITVLLISAISFLILTLQKKLSKVVEYFEPIQFK